MDEDFRLKMAVISGASRALRIKAENVRWTDEKVIQKVTEEVQEIIGKLDE